MSINQDALEDLAQTTGLSEEELKNSASNIIPPEPVKVLAAAEGGVVNGLQTPLTDELRQKLKDPKIQMGLIRDGVEDVVEMGEIHKEIADSAKVCIADTTRIVPRFEGFNSAFNPRSFTEQPSRTNFILVESFMREQIKARQENICNLASTFFSNSITGAEDALAEYASFQTAMLFDELKELRAKVATLKSDPMYEMKQVALFGAEEINVATEPTTWACKDLGPLNQHFNQVAFEGFKKAICDINHVLENNVLAGALIVSLLEGKNVDELVEAEERVNKYNTVFSAMKILEALTTSHIETLLGAFESSAKENVKQLREAEAAAGINKNDFNAVSKFVVDNGELFDNATSYTHYYGETVDTLRRLVMPASVVVDYFIGEK